MVGGCEIQSTTNFGWFFNPNKIMGCKNHRTFNWWFGFRWPIHSDVCWFINPKKTVVISTINYRIQPLLLGNNHLTWWSPHKMADLPISSLSQSPEQRGRRDPELALCLENSGLGWIGLENEGLDPGRTWWFYLGHHWWEYLGKDRDFS